MDRGASCIILFWFRSGVDSERLTRWIFSFDSTARSISSSASWCRDREVIGTFRSSFTWLGGLLVKLIASFTWLGSIILLCRSRLVTALSAWTVKEGSRGLDSCITGLRTVFVTAITADGWLTGNLEFRLVNGRDNRWRSSPERAISASAVSISNKFDVSCRFDFSCQTGDVWQHFPRPSSSDNGSVCGRSAGFSPNESASITSCFDSFSAPFSWFFLYLRVLLADE